VVRALKQHRVLRTAVRVVFVAIRWSDNQLSNVTFDMPVGYFNQDAHCFAGPPPPPTTVAGASPARR
jgi:hypothetical protein